MAECVYADVICIKKMKEGERVERVVEIYENSDAVRGHNPNVEKEDTDIKRNVQTHPTEKDTTWSRCYRLTAVCVVLLCFLLLAAVTVLWITFNNLKTENNQLKTSYNNLTVERDQLQTSNNNLARERDQLKTSYNSLTIERAQLQRERDDYLRRFYDLDKVMCFNSSLYFMSNENKNWTESRQNCRDKGADLVIINSKEEQDFIVTQLKATQAWIGLSDRDKEGEWKWVDGTILLTSSFSNWPSNQPDNYNDTEDCVEIWSGNKQHWNDRPCSHEQGWICEKRN